MEETTTNKFNEEWEKLRPTIIQLSTDTPVTGQCYVDVCISIILEKTSS